MSRVVTDILKQLDGLLSEYGAARSRSSREGLSDLGDAAAGQGIVGIVRAMHSDYSAGQLLRVEQLVEANLFADFLEMAEMGQSAQQFRQKR